MAITRGNTVFFDVSFLDNGGTVVTVTSAALAIKYPLNGGLEDEDVTLTEDDDNANHWLGEWESGVSEEGWVHYTATGTGNSGTHVGDGKIKIVAGKANERTE